MVKYWYFSVITAVDSAAPDTELYFKFFFCQRVSENASTQSRYFQVLPIYILVLFGMKLLYSEFCLDWHKDTSLFQLNVILYKAAIVCGQIHLHWKFKNALVQNSLIFSNIFYQCSNVSAFNIMCSYNFFNPLLIFKYLITTTLLR